MRLSHLAAVVIASSCGASPFTASAEPIAAFTGQTVTTSSRMQTGTLAISGTPQTWSGAEAYPGVDPASASTTFYYNTYTLNPRNIYPDDYVEIRFTDSNDSGNLFLSAYSGAYNPANKQQNWLGDIGVASNHNGGQNLIFDVQLPYTQNLVLVANNTGAGTAGTGEPFNIYVDGYTDTNRDSAPVTGVLPPVATTPEPSSFALLGTGLLGAFGVVRKRFV